MSSYLNMKSRRSFTFFAPYTEEGDRNIQVVFPIAVDRGAVADNKVLHDCNPQIVSTAPSAAATVTVTTKVQIGSLLIVKNTGTAAATVGGVSCANAKVTTLLWDGNAYAKLGESSISS